MIPHYEDAGLRLFHGSNKDVLPTFEAESYDSIVTDPPYELGFMGKSWDSSGIAYDVDLWRECLRVLKPGGYLLAFGGTRTWHRIAAAIEDAGFEIRDSIAWMYGSGFPKSMDVAKAIDGHLLTGRATPQAGNESRPADGEWVMENAVDVRGVPGGHVAGGLASRNYKPSVKRETPGTAEGEQWSGWGTTLKPAFEPIIVARKPFSGTVAANVLAHGTGAMNIEGTRVAIPHGDSTVRHKGAPQREGRWPTNVLLDESQADALDEQSGMLTSGLMKARTERQPRKGGTIYGADQRNITAGDTYGDSGGASRFFPTFRYEAKAPGSERPEVDGVAHATVKPLELMRWIVRLVTRPGGRVLDLFAGSGTTGEAALLEGMEVDLIELEAEHLPLILQRVRKPLQPSMFGDWDEAAS